MKIAILYSGHIRTWDKCQKNHKDNLFTEDTDLYFYTYDPPLNTDYKQYLRIPGEYYSDPLNIYDSNKNPVTNTYAVLQCWHNLFVGFWLVPNTYDIYVKSRCDIMLSGKIDFNQYDTSQKNIYIPVGNDYWGGVNDQFAFGNREVMKIYFSIYLEHYKLFQSGLIFHPEFYITENLTRQGVNIIRIKQNNWIVRDE